MPADKLGRYMRSPEFLKRANEAVAEAVRDLESHGVQPVYRDQKTGRIVGGRDDASREDGACQGHRLPDMLDGEDPIQGAKK
ncbi:conserved hypothetical protein [Paraburkholderia sabiae]|uniref:hypothetical protein n=1 Tax=Paraburkholderia sabiae TaxID=273251 RepID=UPI001CAAD082|nr:hypothetical protein [Paraburkholderia sabiae]CAG9237336.1 conserved hypothetical protein [Paraburkholderia sabiae]